MCGFDRLCFQGVAQRARHSFRLAEIAHENTSNRRTEKIGACIADPSANGEGSEEIDTLTIPDGGRRRVYRPDNRVARDRADSQPLNGRS